MEGSPSIGRRASAPIRSSRAWAWLTAWSMRATFSSSSPSAALRSIAASRWSLASLNASNAASISPTRRRASGEPAGACLVSFMMSPGCRGRAPAIASRAMFAIARNLRGHALIFAGLGAAQAGVGLIDWALYGWGGFQVFALLTSAALLLTALLIRLVPREAKS